MGRWVAWSALGRRVQAGREARHLSQRRFAESIGVTQSTVWGYEQGGIRPPRERLAQIAAVLEQNLGELLLLAGYAVPPAEAADGGSVSD